MERKKLFGPQDENEFLAESELISIVPSFSLSKFELIHGTYGPFAAGTEIEVPLWLAVALKKAKKCRIKAPRWLKTEQLKQCIEKEKHQGPFQQLPFYYREIAKVLLCECEDDIADATSIRVLIKDIEEIRKNKMNANLKQIQPSSYVIGVKTFVTKTKMLSLYNFFFFFLSTILAQKHWSM
ncbi:hypothetical protein RFI_14451 [Reticulomyxa filosa]|uniref:Uncharacterized protein n=1 Tax=Reticulomyxa filosa TaxID=46433 RepID=X6NAE4_RETFI|nr:hypothetical protein RFI_14451 [Reticulomyxa filosa]|eukprot:ETO22739.1 hypothetical protein RFI_14451 [Reticulomyxa filosa]